MNVKFDKIYIFDVNAKEAYAQSFKEGINLITSSDLDGTDRGKSVLLRSLYHALGADSYFDTKWNEKSKRYILFFEVNDTMYSIYRSSNLFKIFDSNNKLLFKTIHRSKLAKYLGEIFDFVIYLPDRKTNQLVIAPPAYSYLLNYLDQDRYDGTKFNSFESLGQFSNFKTNVIYSHLGIYNKNYFELVKNKEELEIAIKAKKDEIDDLKKMKNRTMRILNGFSCPETTEALENELRIETKKYSELIDNMNNVRNKLIELRNQLEEQKIALAQMSKFEKKQETEIKTIMNSKICPECHSVLNDTFVLRSKKYNQVENIISIKDIINVENTRIREDILKYEKEYSDLANNLEEHNKKIHNNQKEIDDYSKFKGLNRIIDEINSDLVSNDEYIDLTTERLKPIKKDLKKVNETVKYIDEVYFQQIDKLKVKFNLNELDSETYRKLIKNFCASGSNKPLSTVIWYLTLNNLKQTFYSDGTTFPMVFDSPNNAETDQKKKHALLQYILDSAGQFNQIIISAIGFKEQDYTIGSDINIQLLTNKKYSLLNKEAFEEYYEILRYMNDA